MIVADLPANLGNQLFAYCATKCVSLDLGLEYRYRVIRPSFAPASSKYDAYGHEYDEGFETSLHIDVSERISHVPDGMTQSWEWVREPGSCFNSAVYGIGDNTRLTGYFLSPQYFSHRASDVRRWLAPSDQLAGDAKTRLREALQARGCDYAVAIHVRRGRDYREYGLILDGDYYRSALEVVRGILPVRSSLLLVFSDCPAEAGGQFASENALVSDGDMYSDLCTMSLCDAHIISNSTFAWWGAWLAGDASRLVIRPSVWPLPGGGAGPEDIYLSEWVSVGATTLPPAPVPKREKNSWLERCKSLSKTARRRIHG